MADNVAITAGSGTTVGTDDVGGVHYQQVKLMDGTLNSSAVIAGDATNGLDVDVTRVIPGTSASHLGKAEDAGHNDGDTGVMALGVRRSDANSLTALAGADNDYIPLVTDSRGVLQVANRPRVIRVQVTSANLTTVTTAYSIGDQTGDIMTFAGAAVATGGTGTILSATMLDKGDVGSEYRLHVFQASVSLASNNSAFAVSDADMQNYLGTIQMPTMLDVGANRVSTAANIGLGYVCAATSLFVAIETRAANAVYAAVGDLWVSLHLLLD